MTDHQLSAIARALLPVLDRLRSEGGTATYADLARVAGVQPPHSIHRTAEALEEIMALDQAEGRPFRAAVAVSAKRGGLPAPGFFIRARELGRYFGPESGPQAEAFHALELERLRAEVTTPGTAPDRPPPRSR